jgi:hypothetical protein
VATPQAVDVKSPFSKSVLSSLFDEKRARESRTFPGFLATTISHGPGGPIGLAGI